jgi:hypothetical protein
MSDRSFKLDEGVSAVVLVVRKSFTVGTEIGVIADGTLVARTRDVALGWLVLAQGAIAEDAVVDLVDTRGFSEGIVNGHEPMVGVILRSGRDAVLAVIPIRACHALVADADNALECKSVTRKHLTNSRYDIPSHSRHRRQRA